MIKKTEIQKLDVELNALYHEVNLKAVKSVTIELKHLYSDLNELRDVFVSELRKAI